MHDKGLARGLQGAKGVVCRDRGAKTSLACPPAHARLLSPGQDIDDALHVQPLPNGNFEVSLDSPACGGRLAARLSASFSSSYSLAGSCCSAGRHGVSLAPVPHHGAHCVTMARPAPLLCFMGVPPSPLCSPSAGRAHRGRDALCARRHRYGPGGHGEGHHGASRMKSSQHECT
jgi:hypothetical protein